MVKKLAAKLAAKLLTKLVTKMLTEQVTERVAEREKGVRPTSSAHPRAGSTDRGRGYPGGGNL
jgi:hypothetical protein